MQSLMDGQSQLDAAKQIGISKSNITRWKDGARAAPDFVVKVARAYGANVLEALVEAEFITEEEAALKHVSPDIDLTKIDGADLAAELDRRIRVLNYLKNLDTNAAPDIEVADVVTELASRRSNANPDRIRPVVDDDDPLSGIDPTKYAAHPRTPNLDEDNPTP